jgi:serine palmitoyltransferase
MARRRAPVIESACDTHVTIAGRPHLNLAAANFLGIANDSDMKDACRRTVDKYGVGSCGPRGFYGSIDTHLELEAAIAKFMGTKDSILYSDGFQTVASAIPAFAKKGDILVWYVTSLSCIIQYLEIY